MSYAYETELGRARLEVAAAELVVDDKRQRYRELLRQTGVAETIEIAFTTDCLLCGKPRTEEAAA
jgi:hypothetical protein